MSKEPEYIGDGVYALFEGYDILLYTDRDNGRHKIYLEPEIFQNLVRVAAKHGFTVPA